MTKLSKINAVGVENCRKALAAGLPGAYARGLSGIHRSSSKGQQRAIEEAIAADGTADLFDWSNDCLIAKED
jgi:hypothetical protein